MHDGCNHGPAEPTNAAVEAPQTGGPARRSVYWRSIEQLSDSPEFRAYMHNEFQPGASEASDDDRRTFIKVMGASLFFSCPTCALIFKPKISRKDYTFLIRWLRIMPGA